MGEEHGGEVKKGEKKELITILVKGRQKRGTSRIKQEWTEEQTDYFPVICK